MKIYEDLRVVQHRVLLVQYLVVILIAMLGVDFWYLQVLRGRYYQAQAENNRSRTVSIKAPRGPLLDRNGRVLVENRPSFNVLLTPEHSDDLDVSIARLARLLRMGEGQVRERLARRSRFQPVVVKEDASLEDVAALEARRLELPEAYVEPVPIRSYPLAAAAAHALGRVGEITERQLGASEFAGFAPGDLVGQAGIEWQYNRSLRGKDGFRRLIVNSRGLEVGEAGVQRPAPGPSLTLTLDAELQTVLDETFAGRAGSAVVLDPNTGEILAMSSTPAYDPNAFTTGIGADLWSRLSSDSTTPLMNRLLQGQYPPGSIFKIVTAAAALEEGIATPETAFYCPGYLSVYNTVFRCNKVAGHGLVSVRQALAQSCNVYFYQVGIRLEIDRIAAWAKRLGLGAPTGVDLPHEAAGLIPSLEWKLRTQKTPWYGGETVSVAIGQGQVTTTPLQLARMMAVVANGGKLVQPRLVRAIGGEPLPACGSSQAPPCALAAKDVGLKEETLRVIREGLYAVVNGGGTGWRAQIPGLEVAGKTGSAQVVGHGRALRQPLAPAHQAHGWFAAFAPAHAPQLVLVVLVEHGGSGAESAAPVARAILARFFRAQSAQAAARQGGEPGKKERRGD